MSELTVVQIPHVAGATTLELNSAELAIYNKDKNLIGALYYGVEVDQYRGWIENRGAPRCAELSKNGNPCRKYIGGRSQREIHEWIAMHGGYCVNHGGEI